MNMPRELGGTGMTMLQQTLVSEQLGRVTNALGWCVHTPPAWAPAVVTPEQLERWIVPTIRGERHECYAITEEGAGSDVDAIAATVRRDGDEYVLNGTKWFSSGAMRPRCEVLIVMGKTDPDAPRHLQQSMLAVPRDAPGITVGRTPHVFGYDHAGGHPELVYENVRVPVDSLLGEEGGGFAISQARLGPGRIHHCMRSIGVAERALGLMVERALVRTTFGTSLAHKGLIQDWIAEARISIDMAREYVLRTAHLMDTVGNKAAATEISGIKVAIPRMVLEIIDRAIQVHGAAGVTQYTPLASMYASMRTLRIADGPDEVHKMTIARREILRHDPNFRMNPALSPSGGNEEPQPFARP
jgi:acyl-CoA dehydrogenase